MSLELAHEFSFWAGLEPAVDFGAGPLGRRTYFEVTGGAATGKRFNATAFGGGGDWILIGPDTGRPQALHVGVPLGVRLGGVGKQPGSFGCEGKPN